MTAYQTENKEQGSMIIIVQRYYLAFHKGQFLVHFFLILSWRISFFSVKDIDIVSYTDVSTPCTVENNIDNVIVFVEQISDALFSWFKNTRLKGNIDKCHLLVRTNPYVLKMKTAQ